MRSDKCEFSRFCGSCYLEYLKHLSIEKLDLLSDVDEDIFPISEENLNQIKLILKEKKFMKLYAIVDKRIPGVVGTFTAPSNAYANRMIMQMDENRPERQYAEDFQLWFIADIDEKTFVVTPGKELVSEFESLFVKE